jgi:hypothetical protein
VIGIATPTVSPALGVTSLIAMVCEAGWVVNVLEAVVVLPWGWWRWRAPHTTCPAPASSGSASWCGWPDPAN